jgi:hypothetical protein
MSLVSAPPIQQPENVDYELCNVAFLDVLGWKEFVVASVYDAALRTAMAQAIQTGYVPDMYPGPPPYQHGAIRVSQFSDCIVFSSNLASGGADFADQFIDKVIMFSHTMLRHGFFVRGAIAMGLMFHRGAVAFGPALTEAALAEKALAKYPRIIVPDTRVPGNPAYCTSAYLDSETHIDVLRYPVLAGRMTGSPRAYYNKIGELVRQRLAMHPESRNDPEAQKVHLKYRWFARYFNDATDTTGAFKIANV